MLPFPDTRWSLVARAGSGAGPLLGLYAGAVAAYLRLRLHGERAERVEDVVQEVLADLLGRPEVLTRAAPGEGSRFRHYLMDLAWGSARNALRRHRRRDLPSAGDAAEEPATAAIPAPEQAAAMDRAWAQGVVRDCLVDLRAALSSEGADDAWRVLHGHLVEGISLRQLAADLGLPLATCHRRLALARTRLRDAIVERLRLAGELGPDEDAGTAATVLLDRLR